jgi:hypothetical protein
LDANNVKAEPVLLGDEWAEEEEDSDVPVIIETGKKGSGHQIYSQSDPRRAERKINTKVRLASPDGPGWFAW